MIGLSTIAPRLAALSAVLVLLAGCGFQPLYGGASFQQLPGVTIVAGDTRQDYLIQDSLRDYIGNGSSPYTLELDTQARERGLSVSAAGIARRYEYSVITRYRLTGAGPDPIVGSLTETLYFDAPSDPYAFIAARANVEERAADQVSERLVRVLATALRTQD